MAHFKSLALRDQGFATNALFVAGTDTLTRFGCRCVDDFYIYVWKKNTPKETAVKIPVPIKTAVDHTIEVEGDGSNPAHRAYCGAGNLESILFD